MNKEPLVLLVRKTSLGTKVYTWQPETQAASWVQRSEKRWNYASPEEVKARKAEIDAEKASAG